MEDRLMSAYHRNITVENSFDKRHTRSGACVHCAHTCFPYLFHLSWAKVLTTLLLSEDTQAASAKSPKGCQHLKDCGTVRQIPTRASLHALQSLGLACITCCDNVWCTMRSMSTLSHIITAFRRHFCVLCVFLVRWFVPNRVLKFVLVDRGPELSGVTRGQHPPVFPAWNGSGHVPKSASASTQRNQICSAKGKGSHDHSLDTRLGTRSGWCWNRSQAARIEKKRLSVDFDTLHFISCCHCRQCVALSYTFCHHFPTVWSLVMEVVPGWWMLALAIADWKSQKTP